LRREILQPPDMTSPKETTGQPQEEKAKQGKETLQMRHGQIFFNLE
jgi:hypothetical protein